MSLLSNGNLIKQKGPAEDFRPDLFNEFL